MTIWEAIRSMLAPRRSDEDRDDWSGYGGATRQQPTDDDVAWARLEAEALVRRARALDVDIDYERLGRRRGQAAP